MSFELSTRLGIREEVCKSNF